MKPRPKILTEKQLNRIKEDWCVDDAVPRKGIDMRGTVIDFKMLFGHIKALTLKLRKKK